MKTARVQQRLLAHVAGLACAAVSLLFGPHCQAQLQWSSYNTSGTLVTANVASGGDSTYGGNVSFTVPSGTELVFVTKTFKPVNLAAANASSKVNFTFSANGGLVATGRELGMGYLSDVGASTEANVTGYWVDLNVGNSPPSFELFYRLSTVSTFFQYDSSHKLSSGKNAGETSTTPQNNSNYGMQFQLNMNSGATGISIGTSASTYATSGAGMTNITGTPGTLADWSYTSANPLTTLGTTAFNQFAFMFNNTASSSVTVTLSGVTLVPANPVFSTQPSSYSGNPGDNVTFTAALNANSDTTGLTYQWYKVTGTSTLTTNAVSNGSTGNGSSISGATTASLAITGAQTADNASYYVVAVNNYGSTASAQAILNIQSSAQAPAISSISATNVTLILSNSIPLYSTNVTVSASGSPLPSYYWTNAAGVQLQGGASATLTLSGLGLGDAGTYSVTASNSAGQASTNFTVNVYALPTISGQPASVLLNLGDPATFTVTSTDGNPTPSYQWYKNGVAIAGANATSYAIGSVAYSDIGKYSVTVSNIAGKVTSASAVLAINSTMTGTPTSPANGATGICYDTPLAITFSQAPSVGSTGKIYIYNAASPGTPVDTIDMSLNTTPNATYAANVQSRTIGGETFVSFPVIISNTTAVIYPHAGVMTNNKTYYVTMDPGVLVDGNGAYFTGISGSSTWQFTTKASGPANATNLVVAADGSGDFCTVQGAVDSVAANNTTPTVINIRNGLYTEIVDTKAKNNLTFRGQSRAGTILGYPNNVNVQAGTHSRMAFKVYANDIALDNLTVSNMTPQGGNQAEALMIETAARRFICNNSEIDSRQDTILANVNSSQGYFYNSLIKGNYDYVWGGGNLFFTNCELRTLAGSSTCNLSAARTDNGATGNWAGYLGLYSSNGISFVNCQLTRQSSAVTNCSMADANGSTNGNAVWIGCSIDTGGYTNPVATAANSQLLWEYGCSNLNDTAALNNSAFPFVGVTQLTGSDARLLAAESATNWLNGWVPQLAPNITSQPASVSVHSGSATFSVGATGIPDPGYQWYENGNPIANATNASYTTPGVHLADNGATFWVAVTNVAGAVTSSVVTLTVTDTAPVAGPASYSRAAGLMLKIRIADLLANASDADSGDTLTLAGVGSDGYNLTTATTSTVTTNSTFIFYTNSTPADVSDSFQYVVSDPLGELATNTVSIAVVGGQTGQQTASPGITVSGGLAITTFFGYPGQTYNVQLSTDLSVWTTVGTVTAPTTPPAGVFMFTNDVSGMVPVPTAVFYRLALP
jgi:Pectinesterase/Immunoglobulin domain/Bacterial Ig-like domain